MRARSHKYPDSDSDSDNYTDTTFFHKEEKYLDVGYQRLKVFNIKLYPELSIVKKLFIDHNNLTVLPDPKYLPNLTELTCSSNKLKKIPFYPKLIFLNIAHNQITDCSCYNNTNLKYFDCSFNPGFKLNFSLPSCNQLYINDVLLKEIDLKLVPNITILDCSNNRLAKITGGTNLVEINIQSNCVKELPEWPSLLRLAADYNQIEVLPTFQNMVSAFISYNKLKKICDQPSIKKIIANNNNISDLGKMPKLELIDFSHNNLQTFVVPDRSEYVSLQFNPIVKIKLGETVLKTIKELQVNIPTYEYLYSHYYDNFKAVSVQANGVKLEEYLKKLSNVFNDTIAKYIFNKFNGTKFREIEKEIFKISLRLYIEYFTDGNINDLDKIIYTKEFKYLLDNIWKLYYKTTVVTLYFNDLFEN